MCIWNVAATLSSSSTREFKCEGGFCLSSLICCIFYDTLNISSMWKSQSAHPVVFATAAHEHRRERDKCEWKNVLANNKILLFAVVKVVLVCRLNASNLATRLWAKSQFTLNCTCIASSGVPVRRQVPQQSDPEETLIFASSSTHTDRPWRQQSITTTLPPVFIMLRPGNSSAASPSLRFPLGGQLMATCASWQEQAKLMAQNWAALGRTVPPLRSLVKCNTDLIL